MIARSMRWLAGGLFAVVLAFGAAQGEDAKNAKKEEKEEKISLDKLPKAVVDAIKAKFPNGEMVSAEKENENAKLVYEIVVKSDGSKLEVSVTPAGKITSIEKEIDAKDLPKAVTDALKAKYPNATIKKAEEVTKGDKTIYEATITTAAGKKLEVELDPSGKILEEEKDEKEKK